MSALRHHVRGRGRSRPRGGRAEDAAQEQAARQEEAGRAAEKKTGMEYETNTYGVVKEEEDEAQEDKDERGDDMVEMYLKQSKSKDPRGPTQEAITKPTNWLIITGACGAVAYVILFLGLIILFWMPVTQPDRLEEGDKSKRYRGHQVTPGVAVVAHAIDPFLKEKEEARQAAAGGVEVVVTRMIGWIQSLKVITFLLFSFVFLIGIAFASVIIYGAVKAQGMESRGWGIASSILAMVPINALGFMIITLTLLTLVANFLYDDKLFVLILQIGFGVVELAWGISIGSWNIRMLLDEKVVAGFEYRDEESEGNVE